MGAQLKNGIANFVALVFLLCSVSLFSYYLQLREIRFDEDKVTSTDYTVEVRNPPPDALDPDEWCDFFSQFADSQVTVVTIALNNEQLVQRLINRRVFRDQLRLKLPKGTDLDDNDVVRVAVAQLMRTQAEIEKGCLWRMFDSYVVPILNIFNMMLPADKLVDKIEKLTEEIKSLQNEKFDAIRVYVTFETEEGQRAALSAMAVSKLDRWISNNNAVPSSCLFHGQMLRVGQPEDPSSIRWLDLSASVFKKYSMRVFTFVLTCGILSIAGLLIYYARKNVGPWLSGPLTSIFNSVTPFVVKILMLFEPHSTEGTYQASLYLKITMVRWFLSAILAKVCILSFRVDTLLSFG